MTGSSPPERGPGFRTARGRGYRPAQVDRFLADLGRDRDVAWRRLAELSVRVEELTREAERLSAAVAALPPPSFESLGERAALLLAEVEAEAADLRGAADAEARELLATAERMGRRLRDEAREAAARRRAAADSAADNVVSKASAEAAGLLAQARGYAAELREEAGAALAEVTRRCQALIAEQRARQAAAGRALEEELAAREAEVAARVDELTARGEAVLARARDELAAAEAEARAREEAAEARRVELLTEARVGRQRVERETERILREHEELADQVRAHLAHIRTTLAALTGRRGRRPVPRQDPREEWRGGDRPD